MWYTLLDKQDREGAYMTRNGNRLPNTHTPFVHHITAWAPSCNYNCLFQKNAAYKTTLFIFTELKERQNNTQLHFQSHTHTYFSLLCPQRLKPLQPGRRLAAVLYIRNADLLPPLPVGLTKLYCGYCPGLTCLPASACHPDQAVQGWPSCPLCPPP